MVKPAAVQKNTAKPAAIEIRCACITLLTVITGTTQRGRAFTFTFMHLTDAFIQSDIQLHSGYTFSLVCVFPGNRTHNLLRCWRKALPLSHTGTLFYSAFLLDAQNWDIINFFVIFFNIRVIYWCLWRFCISIFSYLSNHCKINRKRDLEGY